MTMAPVEYLLVGFPDNEFNGRLAPALADLVERNTVRVLDLVFVSKDDNGDIATFEFDQLDELRAFAGVGGDSRGMINEEDLEHAAEALEPGSSAALLIWEDLWAAGFAEALHDCNAVLLEGGRIPHDLVEAALGELAESG